MNSRAPETVQWVLPHYTSVRSSRKKSQHPPSQTNCRLLITETPSKAPVTGPVKPNYINQARAISAPSTLLRCPIKSSENDVSCSRGAAK
jgi:hypothetical protein